jgi:hypothetical protein
MPYVAELTHRVVVHLDELAATLRKHATVTEHEDVRVCDPPPLAKLAHHPVGHRDHPLDEAMSVPDELTVGRRDHLDRVHLPVQPDAVVLPEVGVAWTAEHRPVGERSHLRAHSLLPGQMPSPESLLGYELRHRRQE